MSSFADYSAFSFCSSSGNSQIWSICSAGFSISGNPVLIVAERGRAHPDGYKARVARGLHVVERIVADVQQLMRFSAEPAGDGVKRFRRGLVHAEFAGDDHLIEAVLYAEVAQLRALCFPAAVGDESRSVPRTAQVGQKLLRLGIRHTDASEPAEQECAVHIQCRHAAEHAVLRKVFYDRLPAKMHALLIRFDPDRRERLRCQTGRHVEVTAKIRCDRRQRRIAVIERMVEVENDAFDLHGCSSLTVAVGFFIIVADYRQFVK